MSDGLLSAVGGFAGVMVAQVIAPMITSAIQKARSDEQTKEEHDSRTVQFLQQGLEVVVVQVGAGAVTETACASAIGVINRPDLYFYSAKRRVQLDDILAYLRQAEEAGDLTERNLKAGHVAACLRTLLQSSPPYQG